MYKLLTILVLSAFLDLPAQEGVLTLQKAIESALANNTVLKQAANEELLLENEYYSSFGIENPAVIYSKEGIDNGGNFQEQRWTILQSVEFPLKIYYRLSSIDKKIEAAELNKKIKEKEVIKEVKFLYIELLYSDRIYKLRYDEVQLGKKLYNAVNAKLQAGESAEIDLMKVELELANFKNELLKAENEYNKCRYNLFTFIGMPREDQSYSINFSDSLEYKELGMEQDDILSTIDTQNLTKMHLLNLEAADNKVSEEWASFLPDLNFGYYLHDYGRGFNYNGFEIGVKVPLWFSFNQKPALNVAKIKKRENEYSIKAIKLEIKKKIEHAWHSVETSSEIIKNYQDKNRKLSEDLLELMLEGYLLGEIDLLNLLDAQKTYLANQEIFYSALREYYLQLSEIENYIDKELVY